MTNSAHIERSRADLEKGLTLSSGRSHRIMIVEFAFHLRLDIDLEDENPWDDKFTLRGGPDPDTVEYEQVRTAQDDTIEGDDFIDLIFTDLIPGLTYSLEIEPGADEDPFFLFEDLPFEEMASLED